MNSRRIPPLLRGAKSGRNRFHGKHRRQASLTREQLAEESAISVWTLRGYKQNRHAPNWKGVIKLARGLGVPVEAFADCTSLHDEAAQEPADEANHPHRKRGRRQK